MATKNVKGTAPKIIDDTGQLSIYVVVGGLKSELKCTSITQAVSKVIQLKEWFPDDYISIYVE